MKKQQLRKAFFLAFILMSLRSYSQNDIPNLLKQINSIYVLKVENEDSLNKLIAVSPANQYGIPIAKKIDLLDKSNIIQETKNDLVYGIRISSPKAMSMDIKFKKFFIPSGSELLIYNPKNGKQLSRKWRYHNQEHGQYVVYDIESNDVILVYRTNHIESKKSRLAIEYVTHAFRSHQQAAGGLRDAKECHIDVHCSNWLPVHIADNNSRSVFEFRVAGYKSTGSLVRQAYKDPNDFEPLFLTARHSIHKGGSGQGSLYDLNDIEFKFNYSLAPNCSSDYPEYPVCSQYGGTSKRLYIHPIQGAKLIEETKYIGADIALLEMNKPPPPHFKVYYSGWTVVPFQNLLSAAFFGIHHPQGVVKKTSRSFAVANIPLGRYALFWHNGITEDGSSGSPLFNMNGRVIGSLSGGVSGCDIKGPDNYGKLRRFWVQNKKVRRALNPNRTPFVFGRPGDEVRCYNNTTLNLWGQYYPASIYQPQNKVTLSAEKVITASSGENCDEELVIYENTDFTFTAGNTIFLRSGFWARYGSEFNAKIQKCP